MNIDTDSRPNAVSNHQIGWTSAIVSEERTLPDLAGAVWRLVPTEFTLEFSDWEDLLTAARGGFRPHLLIVDATVDHTLTGLVLDAIGAGRLRALSETVLVYLTGPDDTSRHLDRCHVVCTDPDDGARAAAIRQAVQLLETTAVINLTDAAPMPDPTIS